MCSFLKDPAGPISFTIAGCDALISPMGSGPAVMCQGTERGDPHLSGPPAPTSHGIFHLRHVGRSSVLGPVVPSEPGKDLHGPCPASPGDHVVSGSSLHTWMISLSLSEAVCAPKSIQILFLQSCLSCFSHLNSLMGGGLNATSQNPQGLPHLEMEGEKPLCHEKSICTPFRTQQPSLASEMPIPRRTLGNDW